MFARAPIVLHKRLALIMIHAAALAATPPGLKQNEYSHRVWRIEDGLPENRIRTITQTPDGYLWVGTAEGLARFDGVRFTVFDRANTPALGDDGILALRLGSDGTLWIGTEGGGLVSYKAGSFRNFGVSEGITNGFVRAIYEDVRKTLWIGTDRGFFRRAGDRFERLDNTPDIPLATVPSIAQDETGRLWAVSPGGLLTIESGRLVRSPHSCNTSQIRGLRPSGQGFLWAAQSVGGGRLKDGCVMPDSRFPSATIRTIVADRDGNSWIGSEGHGLFRMSQGKVSPFPASILPGNTVNVIFEDAESNLWVGCEDGLLRLSRSSVLDIGTAQGLEDEDVQTVYPTGSGDLWIATVTGQVYSISGTEVKRQKLPAAAANLLIRTIYQDRMGVFWLGTFGSGVVRLSGANATVYSKANGMRNNSLRQILEDAAGNIWFALASGVSRWDGAHFRNYYLEDGLSYPSTRCLLAEPGGDVLVGTDAGLNRVHNGDVAHDSEFAAVSREAIWSLYEDSAGTLWLGTRGGGLLRYKAGSIARFNRDNGLISNTIFAILEDKNANLWISTSSGIASVPRRELDAAAEHPQPIHITPYGTADGMASSQMNGGTQPAGAQTASGDLWFASVKGAVRVNPNNAPQRRMLPVLIEKIVADSRTIPLSSPIAIPPGHGRLQIDFTLCDLVSPQRVSFRYKLENFDENWTPALRARSANYTNVPPGNYTFHVVATDPGLPSGSSEATLAFTLQPAVYQTAWFYALLVLAGAAMVWGGFAFFARQTRARYNLLLAERTRLAREMHDTVIQGCVGVATLLEAAAGFRPLDGAESEKLVDQARVQAAKTLEEAREAVWDLRRPQPTESSVTVLFDLARELGSEHEIQIDTEIEGNGQESLNAELDRTILLVGREALCNAVAHAKPARIAVRVIYTPFDVSLEVADDGIGFEARRSVPAESRHFGLVGMRERVEAVGGAFRIDSRPGAGTKVTATMPTTQRFHAAVP